MLVKIYALASHKAMDERGIDWWVYSQETIYVSDCMLLSNGASGKLWYKRMTRKTPNETKLCIWKYFKDQNQIVLVLQYIVDYVEIPFIIYYCLHYSAWVLLFTCDQNYRKNTLIWI